MTEMSNSVCTEKALRFYQKYFHLCSEDEGLKGFERLDSELLMTIFIFGWIISSRYSVFSGLKFGFFYNLFLYFLKCQRFGEINFQRRDSNLLDFVIYFYLFHFER